MYPDLFVGSHLLTVKKSASERYAIYRFFRTISQRYAYHTYYYYAFAYYIMH